MTTIKFRRSIRRSGGSASVALPPEIIQALGWKIGDTVEIWAENGSVILKKVS